ncbi:MAG: hypothetical protein RTV31_07980 [Candidatus Thorarchaeota archaeon]
MRSKGVKGGVTVTELVTYKPMTQYNGVFVLGTILSTIAGYFLGPMFMPSLSWDWVSILGIFVGLPIFIASFGYYYGWNFKVNVVEYNAPEWDYEIVQLTIDEASKLPKSHNKENFRLVAQGNYWMFFTPIIILVFISALPVYAYFEDASIVQYSSLLLGFSFAMLFANTIFTGFKSTSNNASSDFTLPLIRETIKLAKIQDSVPGVANIRVVLDKAESGNLAIYKQPRVLLRIKVIESESYVESWTDDLGAITKVLSRLYEKDDNPQTVWWWISEDRNFRKYVGNSQEGYYVKNPVQSNITFPGVKDARLVTENSIALVVREYLKFGNESEELRTILKELNVDSD